MVKESIAIIDLDAPKYSVASVGEERYVEVTHLPSGKTREFKNKTEFYGLNTRGGWLKNLNIKRLAKGSRVFNPDEFTVIQRNRVKGPLNYILHSAKAMVEKSLKDSGATSYEAYMGEGEVFRERIATLQKYKGGREGLLKPIRLGDVTEYLKSKFDGKVVKGIETDDEVVIRCVELLAEGKDAFIVGVDKDYMGCPVKFFNTNKPEEGVIDCRGFGKLWLNDKDEVKGKGRLFKYFQVSFGDPTDCYKANKQSEVPWGEKGAYKSLVDCKTDKDAWEVLVKTFKKLYPEPKKITTWDGRVVTIDWLHCLQEMVDMAHLQEFRGDRWRVLDLLAKYNVSIEESHNEQ